MHRRRGGGSADGGPRGPPLYCRLVTRRPFFGCLFEIVETLVLTLIIFLVIQTFVAQPYKVQQQSMEHTLEPDQYVLVDKLTPRWDDYSRGDIVVFNPPSDWAQEDGTPFIKRVIGLPGDTVDIRDGDVFINGTKINEPYLYSTAPGAPPQPTTASNESRWVIPSGEVFLMGDHRQNSADSRVFGPVEESNVIGRAWLRYWPLNVFGILPTPTYPELATTSQ
jgi:signal peptidase I